MFLSETGGVEKKIVRENFCTKVVLIFQASLKGDIN